MVISAARACRWLTNTLRSGAARFRGRYGDSGSEFSPPLATLRVGAAPLGDECQNLSVAALKAASSDRISEACSMPSLGT